MNPGCVCSGYDMSTFIRRYGRYLNEKAFAYRQMAFDFTRVKKGYVCMFVSILCYWCHSATMSRETMSRSFSAEGVMRTMTTEKLLKGMPVLQTQIDTLLEFDVGQRTAAVWQKVPATHHMELCCSLPVLRFIPRSWTTASSTLHFCCSSRTWSNSLPPTTTASSTY